MSSLTNRTIILIFCRVSNYGLLLLSPIFLVRIFDKQAYGQYQEFVLYAMLFSGLFELSIKSNLLYFIPKYPEQGKKFVSNTALLMLIASSIGIFVIYLGKGQILARTSYDFIMPLILFVFFFVNLNIFESYWLGKKRSDYVLYYSMARIVFRILAVIIASYLTRDVLVVINTIVVLEIIKCLFVFFAFRNFFTRFIDRSLIREQLKFIVPLSYASVIAFIT